MKFSADYRALALDALRGRWKTAVLAGLVASVLGANIVGSSGRVISNMSQNANGDTPGFAGLFSTGSGGVLAVLVICILAWAVFTVIVGGAVRLGYARFNLNLADGRDAALSDLASQKHRLWDGFCMNFLQGLYVALWSLLLFIPGVVKAYSYAMTPYIMAEHPGLTANEAITESRRIMDGNKWRLFCLDLSFLGWELLCTLPMLIGISLVFAFTRSADTVLVPLILLSIPLSAGFFFLHPYEEAAWAIFYRDITAAPAITCPDCSSSTSSTACSCPCSGSTGNIFMTGARSAPSTALRRTASGAGAAWRPGSTPPPKFWL